MKKILKPAVAAASAVMLPNAVAAQETKSPLVLTFEGVAGTGNHANAYGSEKFGAPDGAFSVFDDDMAFVGSIGLSRAIDDNWDWRLSVSQLSYSNNEVALADDGPVAYDVGVTDTKRTGVDFTVGRKVAMGTATGRLGAGLSYASASTEKGLDISEFDAIFPFGLESDLGTKFQGIGPRFTFDVQSAPVSKDGRLSLIGGVDVNLLAGKYSHSKGLDAYGDIPVIGDDDDDDIQIDLDESETGQMVTGAIKLGLQYNANETTVFRAGVRHDLTRMDHVGLDSGPLDLAGIEVSDKRTSLFFGMDVGF